jgi:subtilisin-like proprotein convertase family protein
LSGAALWLWLAAPALGQTTIAYTSPVVAIPDNVPAGVSVPLSVSGLGAVTDLNFRLDTGGSCDATVGNTNAAINHTFVGDLTLKLTSPMGTQVTLIERRGGTRENFCTTTLDDDGGFPTLDTITSVTGSVVSGSFQPESPLAAFDGQDPNGIWVLNVSDNASSDTGSLRRFSLILETVPADITVDQIDDPTPASCTPGSCSLREAVFLANSRLGPDRILLPASTAIQLTRAGAGEDANFTGDLDITQDLEIVGQGATQTILTQTVADRLFHVTGTNTDLTLRNLRVEGGSGVADGGALQMLTNGRLLIDGVSFVSHRATAHGGAINFSGGGSGSTPAVWMRNCTFEDNRASNTAASDAYGGVMYSLSSGFNENYLRIENCTFFNNRADNGGGALALDGVQSVSGNRGTIIGSTFTQNQVLLDGPGGAIGTNVEGNGLFYLTIIDSIFQQNTVPAGDATSTGGAVAQRNGPGVAISGSLFTDNSANSGGAIWGDFPDIVNTTICSNTAVNSGGGVHLGQFAITIRRSTLCNNVVTTSDTAQFGGGAIAKPSGDLTLERNTLDGNSAVRGAAIAFGGDDLILRGNTIVAPSPLPGGALGSVLRYTNTDAADSLFFFNNILIGQCSYSSALNPGSAFNNIEASGNTCRLLLAVLQAGNQTAVSGASINLGALADNGGPTDTRLPTAPSIAIDAGTNLTCPLDQRGYQRTDAQCDIGSVEVGGVIPPDTLFTNSFE